MAIARRRVFAQELDVSGVAASGAEWLTPKTVRTLSVTYAPTGCEAARVDVLRRRNFASWMDLWRRLGITLWDAQGASDQSRILCLRGLIVPIAAYAHLTRLL